MKLARVIVVSAIGVSIFLILSAIQRGLHVDVQGSATKPTPSPWSVVCDNQGHYTFTDGKGELRFADEFSTREQAERYLTKAKNMFDLTPEDLRRYEVIKTRKWEACPP